MSKALICKGKNTAGEEILFEAHNNEDAALRAESYEVAEFSVEPNPDYKEPQMTDAEEEEAEKDIVTASDLAASTAPKSAVTSATRSPAGRLSTR